MPLRLDMELKDYLAIILKRKWLIIFSFLIMFTGALWYIAVTPEQYKSKTTILVIPQQISDSYARSGSTSWIDSRMATIQQLIMSRSRLTQVIKEYDLKKGSQGAPDDEVAAEKMRKRIELLITRRDAFSISYYHEDPIIAMLVTKRLASFFMEENLKGFWEQASQTEDFLAKRLIVIKKELEEKEEKLRIYRYKYMDELPTAMEVNLARVRQLEAQKKLFSDSMLALEEKKAQLEIRERTLARSMMSTFQDNDVVDSNSASATAPGALQPMTGETAKRARLDELLARYTENHPEVIRLREELKPLERSKDGKKATPNNPVEEGKPIRSVGLFSRFISRDPEERMHIRSEISKINKEITKFKNQLKEIDEDTPKYQAKILRAPTHEQEMLYLNRDYDRIRSEYYELLGKSRTLDMAQSMAKLREDNQFQILDPANIPKSPFSPNIPKIIQLAFIASLGLGIIVVFGLEILNSKISSINDFKHYSNLQVLAAFPVIKDTEFPNTRKSWEIYAITAGLASFAISFAILIYLHAPKMKKLIYSLGVL
jgi:polysaccharide chain length determinant protein (PEP-CTERM system associated)